MARGQKLTDKERKEKEAIKAAAFVKLANRRTENVLNALKQLGRLSSPNYIYTPEQVAQIMGAISEQCKTVADGFKGKVVENGGFQLK